MKELMHPFPLGILSLTFIFLLLHTCNPMPALEKDDPNEIFSLKGSGPSSQTYEIIMLSLCGSIFVFAVAAFVLKTVRKRALRSQSYDYSGSPTEGPVAVETGVAYITAERHEDDRILTTQMTGPLCLRYVPEKETPPVEFLTLEVKPDSNSRPFSSTSSITPSDMTPNT